MKFKDHVPTSEEIVEKLVPDVTKIIIGKWFSEVALESWKEANRKIKKFLEVVVKYELKINNPD